MQINGQRGKTGVNLARRYMNIILPKEMSR